MRPRRLRTSSPLVGAGPRARAGCEEPRHVAGRQARDRRRPPAPKPPRRHLHRRQADPGHPQRRRRVEERRRRSAAPRSPPRTRSPCSGNAYVTSIGRISIDQIKHAMDLYQATNDRLPKDYDEFMNEIIKANNIALPQLPYYQKYGYDENEHKLIVLEYPDLKNQAPR